MKEEEEEEDKNLKLITLLSYKPRVDENGIICIILIINKQMTNKTMDRTVKECIFSILLLNTRCIYVYIDMV